MMLVADAPYPGGDWSDDGDKGQVINSEELFSQPSEVRCASTNDGSSDQDVLTKEGGDGSSDHSVLMDDVGDGSSDLSLLPEEGEGIESPMDLSVDGPERGEPMNTVASPGNGGLSEDDGDSSSEENTDDEPMAGIKLNTGSAEDLGGESMVGLGGKALLSGLLEDQVSKSVIVVK